MRLGYALDEPAMTGLGNPSRCAHRGLIRRDAVGPPHAGDRHPLRSHSGGADRRSVNVTSHSPVADFEQAFIEPALSTADS